MDTLERLAHFTNVYNTALSALLADKREILPFHSEPTHHAVIYQASDGYLTTYHPSPVSEDPQGVIGQEYPEHDLNAICQKFSNHHIQVHVPYLSEPYTPEPPKDLPKESLPNEGGNFFNRQFLSDVIDLYGTGHPVISAPAIQITPIFRLERGIVREITPSRFRLWAPVIEIPTVGLQRLFSWTHADVWFRPQHLNLDPSMAESVARNDLLSLQIIVSASGALPVSVASHDAPTTAAERLGLLCQEFLRLLDESGGNEHEIHRWLKQPSHHLFLDPDPARVWSKIPFGDRESDFVVRRTDGTYTLIEIERANIRIFTKRKAEPTFEFNHACQQVRDWQRYIRDNARTVREELQLDGIDQPMGVVIMGRSADVDSKDAMKRWRDLKNVHEFELFTYDDVCERVSVLASTLQKMMTSV